MTEVDKSPKGNFRELVFTAPWERTKQFEFDGSSDFVKAMQKNKALAAEIENLVKVDEQDSRAAFRAVAKGENVSLSYAQTKNIASAIRQALQLGKPPYLNPILEKTANLLDAFGASFS